MFPPVAVKLPFPLTIGFKQMMQRGIETPDMDVRWVSSLSWYFLNLFGLNGLFRLLLGSDNGATSSPYLLVLIFDFLRGCVDALSDVLVDMECQQLRMHHKAWRTAVPSLECYLGELRALLHPARL
jgi:hypothetical protein